MEKHQILLNDIIILIIVNYQSLNRDEVVLLSGMRARHTCIFTCLVRDLWFILEVISRAALEKQAHMATITTTVYVSQLDKIDS